MKKSASSETIIWQIINLSLAIVFVIIPLFSIINPLMRGNYAENKNYLKVYQMAIESLFSYNFLESFNLPKESKEVKLDLSKKELDVEGLNTVLSLPQLASIPLFFKSSNQFYLSRDFLLDNSKVDQLSISQVISFDISSLNKKIKDEIITNSKGVIGIDFNENAYFKIESESKNKLSCRLNNENCEKLRYIFTQLGYQFEGTKNDNIVFYVADELKYLEIIQIIFTLYKSNEPLQIIISSNLFFKPNEQIVLKYFSNKFCKNERWEFFDESNTLILSNYNTLNKNEIEMSLRNVKSNLIVMFSAECATKYDLNQKKLIFTSVTRKKILQNLDTSGLSYDEVLDYFFQIAGKPLSESLNSFSNSFSKEIDSKISESSENQIIIQNVRKEFSSSQVEYLKLKEFVDFLNNKKIDFSVALTKDLTLNFRTSFTCQDDSNYCKEMSEALSYYSKKYSIDPLLFLSLIIIESNGIRSAGFENKDPNKPKKDACLGLSQICGKEEIIVKICKEIYGDSDSRCVNEKAKMLLFDVKINIGAGMHTLDMFVKQSNEIKYPCVESKCFSCVFTRNINGKKKEILVKDIIFLGLAAGLRRYNGGGCGPNGYPDFGHVFYVDLILGLYDKLKIMYEQRYGKA
ncbi:MAG: hypothetical protein QXR30_02785 [Candidatus Woesearchaeota archaeon]